MHVELAADRVELVAVPSSRTDNALHPGNCHPDDHADRAKRPATGGDGLWDGQPARGHGGTADVVAYAREGGVPVKVV
jgi:hypothetical protein